MNYFQRLHAYKTNNPNGFTFEELDQFIAQFPEIKKEKFIEAMGAHTCLVYEEGPIIYVNDIEMAFLRLIGAPMPWMMWD